MKRLATHLMIACVLLLAAACSRSDALPDAGSKPENEPQAIVRPEKPGEFKLVVTYFDVNKAESITSTLIFREDRVFQVIGISPEFIVVNRLDGKVHLVDIKKAATCEIKQEEADSTYEKYINSAREDAQKTRDQGKGIDVAEAKLELQLLDPNFQVQKDAGKDQRIRLRSGAVDVSFTGEPDPIRMDRIHRTLETLLKLRSFRNSDAIPPQAHLYVLKQLKEIALSRPVEITFLFRMMDAPEKYRWTYEFSPTLTAREWEGVRRIEGLLTTTRSVSFARYERIIAHEKRKPGEPFPPVN